MAAYRITSSVYQRREWGALPIGGLWNPPVLSLAVFQFASPIEPKLASDAKLSYVRRPSDNLES